MLVMPIDYVVGLIASIAKTIDPIVWANGLGWVG